MLGQVSIARCCFLSSQTLFQSPMEPKNRFISKLPFSDAQTLQQASLPKTTLSPP